MKSRKTPSKMRELGCKISGAHGWPWAFWTPSCRSDAPDDSNHPHNGTISRAVALSLLCSICSPYPTRTFGRRLWKGHFKTNTVVLFRFHGSILSSAAPHLPPRYGLSKHIFGTANLSVPPCFALNFSSLRTRLQARSQEFEGRISARFRLE